MDFADAIALVFGGMTKLGPSSAQTTLTALRKLPGSVFDTVVDAGCGTGAQTLVLAGELRQIVHAVDNNRPVLETLKHRADESSLGRFVSPHCLDLSTLTDHFPKIDLLWSEGAAYNIGFAKALESWIEVVTPSGFAVVSELCWLSEDIPPTVKDFFDEGYPAMASIERNVSIAEHAGFRIVDTQLLADECWSEGYYDVLEPRARSLRSHAEPVVRDFADGILKEIEVHRESGGSYGYILFTLQPQLISATEQENAPEMAIPG